MNNCVKLAMLEVSNFYLFHQPVFPLRWTLVADPHNLPPPLSSVLYIVLCKPMVGPGLHCAYCIQSSANLFSVHTVYSSRQTYGCFRPSVFILYIVLCKPIQCTYCIQSSANLWWHQAFSVHIVLYVVLCKPMLVSCLKCVFNNHTQKFAHLHEFCGIHISLYLSKCLLMQTVDIFMSDVYQHNYTVTWP